MITIKEIEAMPNNIKKEVFDFAEFLITRSSPSTADKVNQKKTYSRSIKKIHVSGEALSDTVVKMREESQW